ncbi:conserved domain protein [Streptococcus sp. oral taxon 056 str. F0418]|uniref:hypothetical protein n=1 Tax=Streptococcus sp. oral taxon 056 TaxID=712620 RepID=UPI0002181545|nr:hypothetical protein [Streptococcus sp. oral taxon 056]EGP67511.1 conserved domain protein [Streptococcus sp. oral taxon 056 str. F0418]
MKDVIAKVRMSQQLQLVVDVNYGVKNYIRVKEMINIFSQGDLVLVGVFLMMTIIFSIQILEFLV